MNILFLTFLYPEKDNQYQGVFIKEHARAIKLAGGKITVVVCRIKKSKLLFKKHIEVYEDENGIVTHEIIIESFLYKFIYAFPPLLYILCRNYIKVNSLIRNDPVIHSNIIAPCGLVGYWLSKRYKLFHIITEHWSKVDKFMSRNVFSKQARKAYDSAKCITVVSNYLGGVVKRYASLQKNIVVIPNVVDKDIFKYVPKVPHEILTFTAVARWEYPKLPHLFCEALSEISVERNIRIELNLIGEGSQTENIKNKEYGFKINFFGQLPKNGIAKVLFRTDYFLHASQIETFSVVVAEALCTGTPVIVSNVGALPELVDDFSGVLCNNTVVDWIKGLKRAMDQNYGHEKISLKNSNRFSEETVGRMFMNIYN